MTNISPMSTFQRSNELRSRVSEQSKDLDKATEEVSTGLKQDVFTESRGASGESLEIRALTKANEAFLDANNLLGGRMSAMSDTLSAINGYADEVKNMLMSGDVAAAGRDALQATAQRALEKIVNSLNTTYAGQYLFSGRATDTAAVTLGAGWATTYTGDTGGNLEARVDENTTLEYGVRADHPGLTAIMDSLTTISSTNLNAMSDAAFETFRDTEITNLGSGLYDLTAEQAQLGDRRGFLDRVVERLESRNSIYNEAVVGIEGVDAHEAAMRLTAIRNQLEATYAVTARISGMSILNHM